MTTTTPAAAAESTVAAVVDKLKPVTYLSIVLLVAASVVSAALLGNGWSWALFCWGAAIGPVWLALTAAVYRNAGRYLLGVNPPASRFRPLYPVWAGMGIPFGVLSASFGTAAPDLGLTIYAGLATALPLARLPRMRQRLTAAKSSQDCPFKGACGSGCMHQGDC